MFIRLLFPCFSVSWLERVHRNTAILTACTRLTSYSGHLGGEEAGMNSITTCFFFQPEGKQNEWKLVTLWIGGNDLCRDCTVSVYTYNRACEDTYYYADSLANAAVSVHVVEVEVRNILDVNTPALLVCMFPGFPLYLRHKHWKSSCDVCKGC